MFETILFQNRLGLIGAELHNLLKLFESLVDGRLARVPSVPSVSEVRELVIY